MFAMTTTHRDDRTVRRRRAMTLAVAVLALGAVLIPAQQRAEAAEVCIGTDCDTVAFVDDSSRFSVYEDLIPSSNVGRFYYGNPGDEPLMGDWNCNGEQTPGMYRRSTGSVYLRNSNTEGNANETFVFGNPGDIPVAGDFNGDGCDTLSIYRPSEARFYITNSLGNGIAEQSFPFGAFGDVPLVGDFDGNGTDTVGVYRPGRMLIALRNELGAGVADETLFFGNPGDQLMMGDWDGDGDETPGAYRVSNGTLYLKNDHRTGIADESLSVGQYRTALTASGIDEVQSTPERTSAPATGSPASVPGITPPPDRPASGPLYISGESDVVIENLHVSNPDGACVVVSGSSNVTVRNLTVGPCGDEGIYITQSDDITVTGNYIEDAGLGVLAHQSDSIRVDGNTMVYTGRNFVQFDNINGPNSSISGNRGSNELGGSNAEDLISLWQSNGTSSSPIRVSGNHLRDGGPSDSGSGIMLGDGGGSNQIAEGNHLVDPGQVGIGVAGGDNIRVIGNLIYSSSQPWSNVGIYTWDLGDGCGYAEVAGNVVDWTAEGGYSNGYWDGGGCDLDRYDNDWDASLGRGIW